MNSMAHAAGIAIGRCAPTASALARHSTGRSRLPPAVTLYRMASATSRGHSGGRGSAASRAASISARHVSRYSASVVIAERRRLQLAALVEDLDSALGILQARMAEP